jgi:hypothetical protein
MSIIDDMLAANEDTRTCVACGTRFAYEQARHWTRKKFARVRFCSNACVGNANKRPLHERFFGKISPEPNSGCWLWVGAYKGKGYGHMGHDGANIAAHRLSYEIHHGPIPNGMLVCHRCDTPECVNPDHLWLGTHQDNLLDASQKKRLRPGGHRQRGYRG